MKLLTAFLLVFFLANCGSKQKSETDAVDSAKADAPATTVVVEKDSVTAQPVTEQIATEPVKETPKPSAKTPKCKFQKLEGGDCPRYIFDCASFGIEDVSLSKDQADIWNNLMAFDDSHGDAPVSNPQYVGKTFEIISTMKESDVCSGLGVTAKKQVPIVTSFKLVK